MITEVIEKGFQRLLNDCYKSVKDDLDKSDKPSDKSDKSDKPSDKHSWSYR